MKSESNKYIVLRFVKSINEHDVSEIVNMMAEDHVFIDGMDNKSIGKKGMKEAWEGYFQLFPDYQIEISDITENESVVGLFGYAKATYKNLTNDLNSNFWKTPASWKALVENNKIKHWQVYCDYSELLRIIDKNR